MTTTNPCLPVAIRSELQALHSPRRRLRWFKFWRRYGEAAFWFAGFCLLFFFIGLFLGAVLANNPQ